LPGARILAANLRDLSYIAANLRPDDKREVDCQFDRWSPAMLAALTLRDHAYVVDIDGNPEAAFGAQRIGRDSLWQAWSWGTRRMWRCVPAITDFVREIMLPDIVEQGAWRCEARAMAANTGAHRWLKRMGAVERCALPRWGRGGEDFLLFDWIRDEVGDVLHKPIRRRPAAADRDAAGETT